AVGAIAAGAVLIVLFGPAAEAGVTAPKLVAAPMGLAIEVILTTILATVILGTADRYSLIGSDAAIAVGATIALCGLIALPIEALVAATEAGFLVATEGRRDVALGVGVHAHRPGPDRPRDPEGGIEVAGVDRRREPVGGLVREPDALLLGVERDRREHRPED